MASKAARRRSRAPVERPVRQARPERNLTAARLRAHKVKVAFVISAAAIFVAAMIFARISYAGHSKHRSPALNAPKRFLHVVAADRLQAGIVAPPQASPSATSAPS